MLTINKKQFNKLSKADRDRLVVSSIPKNAKPKAKKKKNSASKRSRLGMNRNDTRSAPVAIATSFNSRAPKISMNQDQCRVQHRELISSVVGTPDFNVTQFSINPGLQSSFPWLSIMAQAWEEYSFTRLRFCYYTRTGTVTAGSFLMAVDYDAADAAPASEQVMLTYTGAVEDAPWKNMECVVSKNLASGPLKRHYLRTGPIAANLDIKTYDIGNFFYGTTDGAEEGPNWGKLWVEYDVTFYVPQLPSSGAAPYGGSILGGGSITPAVPFGPTPQLDPQDLGITMGTDSTLRFENLGDYALNYFFQGSTDIDSVPPVGGAGLTIISSNYVRDTTLGHISALANVRVTNPGATASLKWTLTGTTLAFSGLNVGQAPSNSLN